MGKFNELLASRFNDGPSSILGLSEQEGIRTVSPELMGVYVVQDDRFESQFGKAEKECWGVINGAADVANFTAGALLNPPGSNILATLEEVWIEGTGAASIAFSKATAAELATIIAGITTGGQGRDYRWQGAAAGAVNTACLVKSAVLAALNGFQGARFKVLANDSKQIKINLVIPPGSGIYLAPSVINTTIAGAYFWRERALLPEENAS